MFVLVFLLFIFLLFKCHSKVTCWRITDNCNDDLAQTYSLMFTLPQPREVYHTADRSKSLHAWVIFHAFCRLLIFFFFQNHPFRNNTFRNTIRVSNSLDPDQVRHLVGPDLGPNCLQRIKADATKVNKELK